MLLVDVLMNDERRSAPRLVSREGKGRLTHHAARLCLGEVNWREKLWRKEDGTNSFVSILFVLFQCNDHDTSAVSICVLYLYRIAGGVYLNIVLSNSTVRGAVSFAFFAVIMGLNCEEYFALGF